ncbi:MAG TPA: dihydrodipicolinate reductase [Fibrobacteraceae bacterium]|nr:dihydrodipicolinate reductase [Fibrobacteraceae bacterium]
MKVMVNGFPGNMARMVAETALERGLELVPYSLTGEDIRDAFAEMPGHKIQLLRPSQRENTIEVVLSAYPDLVAVDYTHPSAVNANAEFYVKHGIPFVMGTTGGDRAALQSTANHTKAPCVIAPNMAKQIVAFQAMMEYAATQFPGVFSGYRLSVVESHQKTKADTSGTAKAVVSLLNRMGAGPLAEEQIEKVRQEPEQLTRMGVPQEFLGGHAFHTYALDSADSSVHFEFRHNVCGRKVYAQGTVDAVLFLGRMQEKHVPPRCYSMIDVLHSGAMG